MIPSEVGAAPSASTSSSPNKSTNKRSPGGAEDQLATTSDTQQQQQQVAPPSYLSSIINKSQLLLSALKKQQLSPTRLHERLTSNVGRSPESMQDRRESKEGGQAGASASAGVDKEESGGKRRRRQAEEMESCDWSGNNNNSSSLDNSSSSKTSSASNASQSRARGEGRKPPLPPPPANRHVLQAAASGSISSLCQESANLKKTATTTTTQQQTVLSSPAAAPFLHQQSGSSAPMPQVGVAGTRRHALQEQSLERDAALSLKTRELKHKRTSSIKSALRHASGHLGSLRVGGGSGSSSSSQVKTMPYELFEPPITQRTYLRSRRRGAMTDPKRQMSADTIGLRQLTDEYLQNTGVKPISSSGQCSLVALTQPPASGAAPPLSGEAGPGVLGKISAVAASGPGRRLPGANLGAMHHTFSSMETHWYQTSRAVGTASGLSFGNNTFSNAPQSDESSRDSSQDSLSTVEMYPGPSPWQGDVQIQCKILPDPPPSLEPEEPYETTGDILSTIAGPFRLAAGNNPQQQGDNSGLSATLKRGLSAIQHQQQQHLSSVQAGGGSLNVVVGSLKKSLSNTLDISRASALQAAHHLHSEDSLPAYSSLQNEPDSPGVNEPAASTQSNNSEQMQTSDPGGLIGQLANKLTRQSSRKFAVSKKGLQRALSFDCRNGYKRLEQQERQAQQNKSQRHLLATSSKLRAHNKSSMALSVDRSGPRPYLAQSASQVDFQLPLLPYHKMQEAIVAQRRLDKPPSDQQDTSNNQQQQQHQLNLDADELLCGGQHSVNVEPVEPVRVNIASQEQNSARDQQSGQDEDRCRSGSRGSLRRKTSPPPKLVLDIPAQQKPGERKRGPSQEEIDDGGEEVCAASAEDENEKSKVIVCLPSPNISIDPSFNVLPGSNTFCLDSKEGVPAGDQLFAGRNQLTASDVFSKSSNLIKRPSTLVTSETMIQVAQALSSSVGSQKQQQQAASQVPVVLRSRRQAIVPKKLATDANQSDSDTCAPQVGRLVDVDVDADDDGEQGKRARNSIGQQLDGDEAATVRALRRKRSGGGGTVGSQQQVNQLDTTSTRYNELKPGGRATGRRLSGSQTALPTFCIEPDESNSEVLDQRPDSQMTNADSIVSTGSSTNLSQKGGRNNNNFTVTSAGGLTVSFGSSPARRRSSIAVIPQMQICPGDLLVYSKQLIDRMNQSDEAEPPQFLTIDDKKQKNIWSSFKLFDSRTLKARNELLCSLEDVLASLQPSTFVDEQLSHYKGMLWNEFLYETESRRSASSEVLSVWVDNNNNNNNNASDENNNNNSANEREHSEVRVEISCGEPRVGHRDAGRSVSALQSPVDQPPPSLPVVEEPRASKREHVKATRSSGGFIHSIAQAAANSTSTGGSTTPTSQRASREPAVRSISSRFREKPKLKRGQTVDSVFRIPLIPSSPLKHAQQHQQTPTAHLEDHDLSITLEDDERSSPSSSLAGFQTSTNTPVKQTPAAGPAQVATSPLRSRKALNSSIRSRAGSACHRKSSNEPSTNGSLANSFQLQQNPDSSFETDDALDLMQDHKRSSGGAHSARTTPHQIVRQSSLSTLSSTITRTEQKRQRALWDLFQSECAFFFDHLMTLKNVYMEPLKKIQVEGFAMFADPDVLFGNLDELCCGVYDFCKEFLYIIMRTLKTRPEELNATDVLIKLYKKNPKIDHLRGVYHRYTLNYINALTYLESLRRQVEFVEFEKWSARDVRCKKLQLTDLLVAPVQHIMRVPIILKDIESHTENSRDRDEIRAILAVEEASLRELDDKMRWLKNFERLLEIQKNISWPTVLEMDPKLFIPDFLKDVLSKQPCEKLIVSPRRQIVHEGTLSNYDLGKACDMHVILFDDMLLLTRRKKGLTKKASTVCKTNSGGGLVKDDGSFKYIVYKTPLSLDRFYVHDVQPDNAQCVGIKHLFLLIVMNRFQQITNVHSFSAPNDDIKQTWLFKIKKTMERWKKNFASNATEEDQTNQPSTFPASTIVTQEPVSQHQQQIQHLTSAATKCSSSQPSSKRNSSEHVSIAHRSPMEEPSEGEGNHYSGSMASKSTSYNFSHQQPTLPVELVVTSAQSTSASSSRDNVTSAA